MRSLVVAVIAALVSAYAVDLPYPSPKNPIVPKPTPPILLKPVLYPILHDSERIFSGTVLEVDHFNSASSSALATTSIRFRVDDAIRGVRQGQIIEIKEWGGLWQSGERYHNGERVLLFLYPPSKLGLTSPVGHQLGRFPVDKFGRVLLKNPAQAAPQPIEIRQIVSAIREAERE